MIRVYEGTPVPYSELQLRADLLESTGQRAPLGYLSDDFLARFDVYRPRHLDQPVAGPDQVAEPEGTARLIDGLWSYGWSLRIKTPEERAADRAALVAGVQAEMSRRLEALALGYTAQERETWPTQVDEALAIKAGAQEALLWGPLAAGKGRTLDAQAARVLGLAAAKAAASGAILAAREALLSMDPIPADFTSPVYWP